MPDLPLERLCAQATEPQANKLTRWARIHSELPTLMSVGLSHAAAHWCTLHADCTGVWTVRDTSHTLKGSSASANIRLPA